MYPGFHAATQPDKPAVVMGRSGETITYRELDERSARLARLLYASGLRPGDKVAILAENHPRYYEVYWAAVPRMVDFRAELPRAATGKLHKGQLRAEYLAART